MKKIKLLTSLSSIGALIVTTPIIMNCSTNKTNTNKEANPIKQSKLLDSDDCCIVPIDLPKKIVADDYVVIQVDFIENGFLNPTAEYELIQSKTDDCLNASLDQNHNLIIKPTINAVNKTNKVTFQVTYCDTTLTQKTIESQLIIDNVIISDNWMIYNGEA